MEEQHHHRTTDSATTAAFDQLNVAIEHHKWMLAVWHIDGSGKIHLSKTTYNFPTGSFAESQRMLNQMLLDEIAPPKPAPLPRAKFLAPPVEDLDEDADDVEMAAGLSVFPTNPIAHPAFDEPEKMVGEMADVDVNVLERLNQELEVESQSRDEDDVPGWKGRD